MVERRAALRHGLTLHRVSPLQAVALAAVAVECSLEPLLEATPSTGSAGSPPVLGYRITRVKTPTFGSAPVASPKVSAPTVPREPTKPTTGASQTVIRIYAVAAVLHAGSADEIKHEEAMFQLVLHIHEAGLNFVVYAHSLGFAKRFSLLSLG
jgi:hypothetical protein